MAKTQRPTTVTLPLITRYKCENCDTILDEDERRCPDCNKFATRIDGIICPQCEEFIDAEELAS